jgi:hypothetical protein
MANNTFSAKSKTAPTKPANSNKEIQGDNIWLLDVNGSTVSYRTKTELGDTDSITDISNFLQGVTIKKNDANDNFGVYFQFPDHNIHVGFITNYVKVTLAKMRAMLKKADPSLLTLKVTNASREAVMFAPR